MKKTIAMLMVLVLALTAVVFAPAAFAEEKKADLATSATESGVGGINYGAIDWSEDLQVAAIKEFLKGGKEIADPAFAQDDSGYNYRNMMQLATCYNDVPTCTNLELVLNTEKMSLCGVSEAGTGKTIEFQANPNVSVAWSKQLNEADEAAGYNYYSSYGLTYYGQVRVYTAEDLETEEGQDGIIRVFDTYYNTGKSFWAGYSKGFADAKDDAALREAKLAYATKTINGGAMVVYEIVPTKIVVTCPVVIMMAPQYFNGVTFTTPDKDGKFAYDLNLSAEFLQSLVDYKAEFLKDEKNVKAVEEYYAGPMFAQMDGMIDTMMGENQPHNVDYVKMDNNAAGLKTQFTYIPA